MKDIGIAFPSPKVGNYKTITAMYNGMIAPLLPYAIKGALWYQGEANGPFWLQYRRLLPTLIADWRERFQVGDFPFLIVSLANLGTQQTKPIEAGLGGDPRVAVADHAAGAQHGPGHDDRHRRPRQYPPEQQAGSGPAAVAGRPAPGLRREGPGLLRPRVHRNADRTAQGTTRSACISRTWAAG